MLQLGVAKSILSLSDSVGNYLKAIWILAEDQSVSTKDLAEHLGVTAPSVTGMLSKLAKLQLVSYEPYYGASLTEQGRREALRLLRRHRLIETFLIDYLDYTWDEVHEEAELMEHTMTDRFTERLAEKLGQPTFDPHGDPIPTADGKLPQRTGQPLTKLQLAEHLEITRIRSQDSEVLGYLFDLGIKPGVVVELVGLEPFGKLMRLKLEGKELAVSADLAEKIEGIVSNYLIPTPK